MTELLAKYTTVFLLGMIKFLFSLTTGYALGLSFMETTLATILGMMSAVLIFTFLGKLIKKYVFDVYCKPKKIFSKRKRWIVKVWRKRGLAGIAFLTPFFLTPVGGTLIVVSFNEPWHRIFIYMLISALIWGFAEAVLIFFVGDLGIQWLIK